MKFDERRCVELAGDISTCGGFKSLPAYFTSFFSSGRFLKE